jgi:lipopolysaccharide/colanic/teichoic acid biosynthesis glycosyltransferase
MSRLRPPNRLIKRLFDIISSFSAIVLFFPLLLFLAFWIKLEGLLSADCSGPLFFAETRISRGRPFSLYKFRTVRRGTLASLLAKQSGDSITPYTARSGNMSHPSLTTSGRALTRVYFDELPQLLNILKGDMSMVGPRPHTPDHYSTDMAAGITSAQILRTGLFGLVQASKGDKTLRHHFARLSGLAFTEESVMKSIDALYLQRCRELPALKLIAFDLWIMWRSLLIVLRAQGL